MPPMTMPPVNSAVNQRASQGPAGVPHYVSADSAPRGFAVVRGGRIAISFLLTFALVSSFSMAYLEEIIGLYAAALSSLTGVPREALRLQDSIGLRLFFLGLIVLLGVFAPGSIIQRFKMIVFSAALYITATIVIDLAMLRLSGLGTPGPFSAPGSLINGLLGVLVIAVTVFAWYQLPPPVRVEPRLFQPMRYTVTLAIATGISVTLVVYLIYTWGDYIEQLRWVALLGGLGPGIILFFPVMAFILFFMGSLERIVTSPRRRVKRWQNVPQERLLSVAFLVPAYNEAHGIAACIRALDRAAAQYPGLCRLYIVDNASKDNTFRIAEQTLLRGQKLTPPLGKVLSCTTPGKSKALNFGLTHIKEDLIIRVDADTEVAPDLLLKVVPHFWNRNVGGVAGLTLPKGGAGWISRMRSIEVYYNVGFLRVAQNAVDGIMVLPGIMAAYRRTVVQQLNGFGEGFNGEDTDMTVRIGRLGYRVNVDPAIRVYTEVPDSLAQLREQRLRWTRSYFHVVSRNADAIKGLHGTRGFWILPSGVFSICRRLIVIPILIYALAALIIEPSALFLRHGVALVAVVIGPQVVMVSVILLLYRQLGLIPFVPLYMVFRLIRTYIALESFLTLPIRAPSQRLVPSTSLASATTSAPSLPPEVRTEPPELASNFGEQFPRYRGLLDRNSNGNGHQVADLPNFESTTDQKSRRKLYS